MTAGYASAKQSVIDKEQLIRELEDSITRLQNENASLRQQEEAEEELKKVQTKLTILDSENGSL